VTLRIEAERVPLLPGARDAWEHGMRTGGAERNESYLRPLVEWTGTPEALQALLIDPQTSGGLLVAVPADRTAEYLSRVPGAVEIGEVVARAPFGLVLA